MASTLTQPTPITIPWASVGNKRTIPTASQIGVVDGDGKASYPDGYPPLCGTPLASGGKPPSILDENGILFEVTSNLRFLLGGGCPKFNATMATAISGYPLGAVLQDDAGVDRYQSLVNGNSTNFNTTPASIGVSWKKLSIGSRPGHTYTANDWCWVDQPGGLIWAWGSSPAATTGTLVTLPLTFPNAILAYLPGAIGSSAATAGAVSMSVVNTSQITLWGSAPSLTASFFVLGR